MGRGFSNRRPMNGRTMWEPEPDEDVLIFPSDIKADLVELMRIRNLFANGNNNDIVSGNDSILMLMD